MPHVVEEASTLPPSGNKLFAELLAALASWCPALAEFPWLPEAVAPFLEVFSDDSVLLFEACAAFFLNWGKSWLSGPWVKGSLDKPREVLEYIHNLLAVVDSELLDYLEKCMESRSGA